MRLLLLTSFLLVSLSAHAVEPCRKFHGRATFGIGDGQLRIWHIGTRHTFMPADAMRDQDDVEGTSWEKVFYQLGDPPGTRAMYADFVVCPTVPFVEGAAQRAEVKSVRNRRFGPL